MKSEFGVGACVYTGTVTCFACGATTLVVVLLPDDDEPQAILCLTCGRPQPVGIDAKQHRA